MGGHIYVTLLITTLLYTVNCELCSRPGYYCKNGQLLNGKCECNSGFTGFDCSLTAPTSGNASQCQNGGVVYDNTKCLCGCEFYGPVCQYKAESVTCKINSMSVELAVTEKYNMEIFAVPNQNCRFKKTGSVGGRTVFKMDLKFASGNPPACSKVITNTTSQTGAPKYSMKAHVREKAGNERPNDWDIIFECDYPARGTYSIEDATKLTSPLGFAFSDSSDNPVTTIPPNNAFHIIFFLQPDSGYKNISLNYLSARDPTNGRRLYTYIEDNIVPKGALDQGLLAIPEQIYRPYYMTPYTAVSSTRVKLNGMNETALFYLDYRIWVCNTTICPEPKKNLFPPSQIYLKPNPW